MPHRTTTITTWNVNGLRAAISHGLLDWIAGSGADVLCLQETKALPQDVPQLATALGSYRAYWQPARKKGYSGVVTLTRIEPDAVAPLGIPAFDEEGRVLMADFGPVTLINAYFPNSQAARARLPYKLEFCQALLDACQRLRKAGRSVILCGDYNIAHTEIDLTNPRQNVENPGFLPEERAWMDRFLAAGYLDAFRMLHPEPERYTWWSYRFEARKKNIGWRIDTHCISPDLAPSVEDCVILPEVMGSDHCPVALTLKGFPAA